MTFIAEMAFIAFSWPILYCAAGSALIAFLMVYITSGEGRRSISAVKAWLIATLIGGIAAACIFAPAVLLGILLAGDDNEVSMQAEIEFWLIVLVGPAVVIGMGGLLGAGVGAGLRRAEKV